MELDCRHQLSPFLQHFPSAPLQDQNFPGTTREQLSLSRIMRLASSTDQEAATPSNLVRSTDFSPRGAVLFITNRMFVAQATQRAQIALGTRAGGAVIFIHKNRSVTFPQPGM